MLRIPPPCMKAKRHRLTGTGFIFGHTNLFIFVALVIPKFNYWSTSKPHACHTTQVQSYNKL